MKLSYRITLRQKTPKIISTRRESLWSMSSAVYRLVSYFGGGGNPSSEWSIRLGFYLNACKYERSCIPRAHSNALICGSIPTYSDANQRLVPSHRLFDSAQHPQNIDLFEHIPIFCRFVVGSTIRRYMRDPSALSCTITRVVYNIAPFSLRWAWHSQTKNLNRITLYWCHV